MSAVRAVKKERVTAFEGEVQSPGRFRQIPEEVRLLSRFWLRVRRAGDKKKRRSLLFISPSHDFFLYEKD